MKRIISSLLIIVFFITSSAFAESDGIRLELELETIEGIKMIPVREVFEAMGLNVQWNGGTRTVSARNGII